MKSTTDKDLPTLRNDLREIEEPMHKLSSTDNVDPVFKARTDNCDPIRAKHLRESEDPK